MIICFDLDGTLVDTEDWIVYSFQKSFRNNNKKIPSKKIIFDNWGITCKALIKKTSPEKLTLGEEKEIRKNFYKIRKEEIKMIKPFKNSKKILKKLKKDYTLVITSNNPHKEIINILNKAKIDKKLFEVIIGDDEVKRAKPFPDEIYATEKKLNKKVNVLVGDTIQDIKTAKSANIKSIIIKNGPKQTWKKLKKADFIIKDINKLPEVLKEVKNGSTT